MTVLSYARIAPPTPSGRYTTTGNFSLQEDFMAATRQSGNPASRCNRKLKTHAFALLGKLRRGV
jgi:hypothetical protein